MNTVRIKSKKYPGCFYVRGYSSIEDFLKDFPTEILFPVFDEYVHFYTDQISIDLFLGPIHTI